MKLAQIKEQVAALLDVELVYSGEVRQVLNTELNNTELSKANWNAKATWETALAILNNAKYDRKQMRQEGVNEDLGSQCGGGTVAPIKENGVNLLDTGNSLITDTSNSNQDEIGAKHCNTKGQEYRLFLPEVIPAIVDKLDDNNTYKVDRGTGHTPVVYHLCIDNKDKQTKLLVVIGSWVALSTIQMYYRDNLISKAIKSEQQTTVNQDKVNSSEVNYIVTLTDYPQVVIKDDYNPKELTSVTEEQLLGSLYTDKVTAEMMFPGSYYQVLEVNPNNIKQQLMQHYNLEETSDIVATVTSDNKFYALVHSQADEVYIVTPYCLTPKRLVDCKDKELKESLYASKEVAAEEANEWLGDNYQVVEIDYNNIRCDIKAYFRDRVLVSQLNCYLPKDEASTKGYYYKGIPIEHFNHASDAWLSAMGNNLDNSVLISTDSYEGIPLVNINNETVVFTSSFLESLKLAKDWLGVNTVKVPSTEVKPFDYSLELAKLKSLSRQEFMALIQEVQHVKHFSSYYLPKWEVVETYFTKEEYELATNTEQIQDDDDCHWLKLVNIQDCFSEAGNYHYSQMQLTPKLELFAKFIEYTFLMQCYLELIGYFYNLSSSLSEISNQLYLTWCSLTAICFKRYVLMPTIGSDNHTKLLMMWYEATYNSLERKSIYA